MSPTVEQHAAGRLGASTHCGPKHGCRCTKVNDVLASSETAMRCVYRITARGGGKWEPKNRPPAVRVELSCFILLYWILGPVALSDLSNFIGFPVLGWTALKRIRFSLCKSANVGFKRSVDGLTEPLNFVPLIRQVSKNVCGKVRWLVEGWPPPRFPHHVMSSQAPRLSTFALTRWISLRFTGTLFCQPNP